MAMEFVKSEDEVVFSTSDCAAEEARRELAEIREQQAQADQAEFDFECSRLYDCM